MRPLIRPPLAEQQKVPHIADSMTKHHHIKWHREGHPSSFRPNIFFVGQGGVKIKHLLDFFPKKANLPQCHAPAHSISLSGCFFGFFLAFPPTFI
ncbi:MAG: hypothetical protein ACYC6S_08630 [Desulfobulbia bacterium]